MSLRTAQLLKNLCYFGAVIAAVVTWFLPDGSKTGLLIVACTLFVAGFVVTLLFYRCPHCKRNLPANGGFPDICPHCGEVLRK